MRYIFTYIKNVIPVRDITRRHIKQLGWVPLGNQHDRGHDLHIQYQYQQRAMGLEIHLGIQRSFFFNYKGFIIFNFYISLHHYFACMVFILVSFEAYLYSLQRESTRYYSTCMFVFVLFSVFSQHKVMSWVTCVESKNIMSSAIIIIQYYLSMYKLRRAYNSRNDWCQDTKNNQCFQQIF